MHIYRACIDIPKVAHVFNFMCMWANLPYMWNAKVKLHLHSGSARLRKKAVEVSEALEKTTEDPGARGPRRDQRLHSQVSCLDVWAWSINLG